MVKELVFGQKTAVFARQKSPELEKSSFSLVYGRNGSKSLDLIAKYPNDFRMWTEGIRQILKMLRANQLRDVNHMRRMIITLPILPGRRSSGEIYDVDTNLDANDFYSTDTLVYTSSSYVNGIQSGGHGPTPVSISSDKQGYQNAHKQLVHCQHQYAKRKLSLSDASLKSSPYFALLSHLCTRVDSSLRRVVELYGDGNYQLCDDELWRVGVDLEAWKNCVAAIKA